MINTRLFNLHDIVMIMVIAMIVRMIAAPLLHRIGGRTEQSSTDTQ